MWHLKFKFNLNYNPSPKGRPRMTKTGHVFTPKKTADCESDLKVLLLEALNGQWPIIGPVRIVMTMLLPRPKNHYGTGKNKSVLKDKSPTLHFKRPDLDNLEKLFFDAANELLYQDDAQICSKEVEKVYATPPDTNVGYDTEVFEWRQ